MRKLKKISFILILLVWTGFAQAADLPEGELEFCVDAGKIYFFQPQTGRIFVYQTTTNRFSCLLTLEKLGEDLKRSRSLPVIEDVE